MFRRMTLKLRTESPGRGSFIFLGFEATAFFTIIFEWFIYTNKIGNWSERLNFVLTKYLILAAYFWCLTLRTSFSFFGGAKNGPCVWCCDWWMGPRMDHRTIKLQEPQVMSVAGRSSSRTSEARMIGLYRDHLCQGLNSHLDVSENRFFSPQIIHFNRVFQYKLSILECPYFWKHPCVACCQLSCDPAPVDGASLLRGSLASLQVRCLKFHSFHIAGDGHQPNGRGLYTH